MTTCSSQTEAARIAAELIDKRLAGCVQASQIQSTYRWQGNVETAQEVRLLIKATNSHYAEIESLIKLGHSYANPEIIAIPIVAGSEIYLDWISNETSSTKA